MTGTNQNFSPEQWKQHVEKYRADVARVTPPPSGQSGKGSQKK